MKAAIIRSSLFRVLRITVVVLALIGCATWLRAALSSLKSEQGVINAEIMQIRTPITGVLEMSDIRPGMVLKEGDLLFKIQNPRCGDRETVAQFNILQTQVDTLRGELAAAQRVLDVALAEQARAVKLYNRQLIARVTKELEDTKVLTQQKLIQSKKEQLARTEQRTSEMEAQMKLQKESTVTMPQDGLIWAISGKNGEQVNVNSLVLEVINPAHVWVDAFFSERHAMELKPGLPAAIRSLDSATTWAGHLQSVRAGVGRFAYDNMVAVPPPETAKRQIAVRVESDWNRPFTASEFFGVGRSVEVTFNNNTAQTTVADIIKAKCLHAVEGLRGTTAKRSTSND